MASQSAKTSALSPQQLSSANPPKTTTECSYLLTCYLLSTDNNTTRLAT